MAAQGAEAPAIFLELRTLLSESLLLQFAGLHVAGQLVSGLILLNQER